MAHTHAGTVNEDLLRSSGLVVEVQSAVVDVEGSVLLLRASTASILRRQSSKNAALGCIEARVLHTTPGVDSNEAKSVGLRRGKRRGSSGNQSGEDDVLELHF